MSTTGRRAHCRRPHAFFLTVYGRKPKGSAKTVKRIVARDGQWSGRYLARLAFSDPEYREKLQARLNEGRAPHIELFYLQHLYGKPVAGVVRRRAAAERGRCRAIHRAFGAVTAAAREAPLTAGELDHRATDEAAVTWVGQRKAAAYVRPIDGVCVEFGYMWNDGQMFKSWEQLEAAANEKRQELEARGWRSETALCDPLRQ